MKFKAPGRKKKDKTNEAEIAAALAEPEPETPEAPAAELEAAPETAPVEEAPAAPAEDVVAEEPTAEPVAEVEPEAAPEPVPEPDAPVEEAPAPEEPEEAAPVEEEPAAEEEDSLPEPPCSVEINGMAMDDLESPADEPACNVELAPIPPLTGILKKGPYISANASPKMSKTLKKQKWVEQFCRLDPELFQIFCCDKKSSKLYDVEAPTETDGKCMFFHVNTNTVAEAGVEEEGAKVKDYTFKITGLNASDGNCLSMACTTAEDRDIWVKTINRTVNRISIDKARLGDHTKLRQMLTGQEAEISILEEELEKMAVVATECSGRCFLAEEKLTLKEREADDVSGKLAMANTEIASLRSQLVIMEERTKNLNILADDVNGVSAEEVEAAKAVMNKERSERLRTIQLELGGDQDYLENYKKYLNLKRDSVLQRHGSTFSVNSPIAPKSPMTPGAPTA